MQATNFRLAAKNLSRSQASNLIRLSSRLCCRNLGREVYGTLNEWAVYFRAVDDTGDACHLTGKELVKALPRWAKGNMVKSIGNKVSAFYKANNAVITDMTQGPLFDDIEADYIPGFVPFPVSQSIELRA